MPRKSYFAFCIACFLLAGWVVPTQAQAVTAEPNGSRLSDGPGENEAMSSNSTAAAPLGDGGLPTNSPLQNLHVAGGISAGEFYASATGPDTSSSQTLLSNFLVELSGGGDDQPIAFAAAAGETVTPSLLSPPEATPDIDLEYASLSLKTPLATTVELGLLKPDAGFEDTYTYNNNNVVLGALASQQPYNASGVKLRYGAHNLNLSAAYYGKRLDESEYEANGISVDHAWEVGIGTTISEVACRLYHYHMDGFRSLTGGVIEHDFNKIHFALNIDWWQWDKAIPDQYGSRSAVGGAFYAVPDFGKFSLPLRVEYIDQGSSGIYLKNQEAKSIYAATISPTYRYSKASYLRIETSYVQAAKGFTNKDGEMKDDRIYLAMELGYLF